MGVKPSRHAQLLFKNLKNYNFTKFPKLWQANTVLSSMISNFSLSFLQCCLERTTETRIYNCITFYFEFRYFFTELTKEKKLVWQSSREAPLVCELTFVIFQTFCFPQIYTILGCIGGLLGRKMRKCASVIKLWWRLGDTTSCWKAGFPLVDSRHVILAIKMADRSNWPETAWWDGEEHMAGHLSSTVRS